MMKTLLYKEDTITLFKFLKCQTPKYIYSDGHCQVIFNYQNFHIIAFPEDLIAASQNKFDEIIRVKFEYIDSAFQPKEYDKLLFHGKAIDRLYILRTILYFTDHVLYNSEAEALGDFEIETGIDRVLADMMRKSTGGHDEVVCHPKSEEAKNVDKEFSNLVDAGIMLQIDNKLLMCFAWDNRFCIVGKIKERRK
ncbi:MAG: hypothetical protein QNJ53_18760 [Pleurocapsa sp. MO_192.B19]|nr:hypothetical protein [Pleurocapsa sp. MO_192.B19]